jgi:hypothetical protein
MGAEKLNPDDLTTLAVRLREHAAHVELRATLAALHDDLLKAAKAVEDLAQRIEGDE